MCKTMRILIMVIFAKASLATVAFAAHGTATLYGPPYVPSSCYGYKNEGDMIAAASDAIWENGAACGRYYTVTCTGPTNEGDPHPCTGKSHVVKIVDYCPPSVCQATIDLSQQSFSVIANTDAGKIKIKYYRN